ncbi:MAG: 2-isopropylmalate synthase [Acidobacteriota bacterium]|jgi:2-isopropylmalate synthase|nr:2-isopropylmalate synthase [Acidobacteriota bacterium]
MTDRVLVFDTTLRDGEQSPGASMTINDKMMLAEQLERLRVDVIEAGFPISSDGDFDSVRSIAEKIRSVTIAGLARASKGDIDRCWEAVKGAAKPRIHVFIATSDIHLKYKLKKTRDEVLEEARKAVAYAKSLCPDVEFSAEDSTRSDLPFLANVVEAVIEAGATVVNIPDTVGYTFPTEYAERIQYLRSHVPNIGKAILSVHCHNDLGLAVANSLIAVQNGVRQVECTVNGIGERAGNASLEEIVMAMRTRKDLFGIETGINTREIYSSSAMVTNLTGMIVQPNKAIVGRNAFAHEAGIHQDGVIKEKLTYEIMRPEDVGIKESKLVMGKHSGRHALRNKYEELGFHLNDAELEKAYILLKKVADKKKDVYDEDLIVTVRDALRIVPTVYKVKNIQSIAGNQVIATATILLEKGGVQFQDSATGDGPVDAVLKAVNRITGMEGKLIEYTVRSITRGADAVGEVFMKVDFGKASFIGKAASLDIVDASARAYVDAVNKSIHYQMALAAHNQQPTS